MDKEAALKTVNEDAWMGGVNLDNLQEAEYLAYGWHFWFKAANASVENNITLDRQAMGTCHGLSKMPYIRDTRRSIGLNNFVMKVIFINLHQEKENILIFFK